MKTVAQQKQLPVTLQEWESVLTNALLRVNDNNADPIHSFEISPETLAIYAGFAADQASSAESSFRNALRSERGLYTALRNGSVKMPTSSLPNCFAILIMSVLVYSQLDGINSISSQYRPKLAEWLGINRPFQKLTGISQMWETLVDWLDSRIAAGDNFRPLILPDPKGRKQIGYTSYLSFPTRRDVTALRRLIEQNPKAIEDGNTLIIAMDQLVDSSNISHGMQEAFQDFRISFRAGSVSADHRFWKLVLRAGGIAGHFQSPAATLKMEFNQDGDRSYSISMEDSNNILWANDISSAARCSQVLASPNLGSAARRGVLFFHSSGLASWKASAAAPMGVGPFHLAVEDSVLRGARVDMPELQHSSGWHITVQPISGSFLQDIIKKFNLFETRMAVRTVGLTDGVRVGKAWLGLPRFLPSVEGYTGEIQVADVRGAATDLRLRDGSLIAKGKIDGEFVIGDTSRTWSRRERFVSRAHIHAQLVGASYRLPAQREWQSSAQTMLRSYANQLSWDGSDYRMQDMLEAIYASSRSGISEGDIVALIERAAKCRTWDVLRTLQESTFIEARLLERWRGRVFTLVRPTLSEIAINGVPVVFASGALPSRLETDFVEAVTQQGGQPFRRLDHMTLAPPLLGAKGVSASVLADSLGWTFEEVHTSPSGTALKSLIETDVHGDNYKVASEWDWATGHFRVGSVQSHHVRLVRLVHPSGRDHDIYRVIGLCQRSFASRQAAIIDAYRQAEQPLFRVYKNRLERITAEGSLPLEIAKALRVRTLYNSGACESGWSYNLAQRDISWLKAFDLGNIEGIENESTKALLGYRRGRGSRRPLWKDGLVVI